LPDGDDYRQAQELLELHHALAECLAALPKAEQRVYTLRFEQGLSGRATAAALGVPESTFREKTLPGLFGKLARCMAAKGHREFLSFFSAHERQIEQKNGERKTS